jgi:hypothetical protein
MVGLEGYKQMMIQNRNNALVEKPGYCHPSMHKHQGYYVVVPADLLGDENSIIDELITFAFDTLGAWHLEVRVHDKTGTRVLAEAEW